MDRGMIFGDFAKALAQLPDPRFRAVLWRGISLSLALLAALTALFVWGASLIAPASLTLPWLGTVTWLPTLISFAALPLMLGLSVFLMVPVASAFSGLFLEQVAAAVEDRYYPTLPPVPPLPLAQSLADALSFLALLVAANLIGLIAYGFAGPLAPVIFWAVNGYLLGREYFQLAAMRRLGRDGAKALRKRHSAQIWLAGTLMAVPLSMPFLNLLVPVAGAATFTHLFHRLAKLRPGEKSRYRQS